MSFHTGLNNAKLYLNTGTYAVPVWTEIKRVSDVTISTSKNTSTVVTRESPNQKTVLGSLIFQISGNYVEKISADTVLAAFRTSLYGSTPDTTKLDIAAMNQPIAGGAIGIRGYWALTQFDRNEGIEDVVSRSFTLDEIDMEESSVVVNVASFVTPGP